MTPFSPVPVPPSSLAPSRPSAWQVCGVMLAAGYLILATLSGADRMAGAGVGMAWLPAWPYDGGSARLRAASAAQSQNWRDALAALSRALRSAPLDQNILGSIGSSQIQTGDADRADRTFAVAGRLGWHNAATQIYALSKALSFGNTQLAGQHGDALLRSNPDARLLDKIVPAMFAAPNGAVVLAGYLRRRPGWLDPFAGNSGPIPADQLRNRAQVLRMAGPGVLACDKAVNLTNSLIDGGAADLAHDVWANACGAGRGILFDPAFQHTGLTDKAATDAYFRGFAWFIPASGDLEMALVAEPAGGNRIALTHTGASTLAVLQQRVVLQRGHYRLTWRMPDVDANRARAVRVSLGCKADLGGAVPAGKDRGAVDRYSVELDATAACDVSVLSFWLAPQSATTIAAPQLEPVRAKDLADAP